MNKMIRRILSCSLAFCLIATLVPAFGITANAVLGENEAIYSVNCNEDGVTDNVIVAEYNGVSYVMGSISSDGKAAAIPTVARNTSGNDIVVNEVTAERFTVTSEFYKYSGGSYWIYRLKTESGYLTDNYGFDHEEHKLVTVQESDLTDLGDFSYWRKTWEKGWFNRGYAIPIYLVVDGSDIYFKLCNDTSEEGVAYIKVDIFSKGCQHPNMQYVPAVSPTCKKDGNGAYWYCPDCDSKGYSTYFSDEIGLNGSFNPPITMSYGAVDADHDGVCDDCGKNMPVFKKVTEDSQIVAGGKYILVTKVGDQYYAATSGTEQYGSQLPAVVITPSEDGTFAFEETTQAMTIELGFAHGCTEWGNGIRYGFITKFNESRSEFAPGGWGEFLFDEYDIRGAKYGFYVGLNADGTAKIHSAYSETDTMRSYTNAETQLFTMADYSLNESYTATDVYLYRLTDTGTVNANSYDMTLVKSETDYDIAVEGGSDAEGGTNVTGITDALTQTAVNSIVSSFVTDCSISDGEHIQIDTSVNVTVTNYSAGSSITFSLQPTAMVSGSETAQSYVIPDSAFDGTTPMTVTLYTGGINPAQIIHEKEDGTNEYFYPEDSKEVRENGGNPFYLHYDNSGNSYVSFTVTEYSEVKLLAKAVEFTSVNVSLAEDIAMNCFLTLPAEYTDSKVKFTMNGKSTIVDGTLYDEEKSIYKFVYTGVAPQCIGDAIRIEVIHGKDIVAEKEYSVKTYLDNLKEMTAHELGYSEEKYNAMVALINDLLVYGGAAQKYMGHNTDAIVSEGITGTAFAPLSETDKSADNNGTGITVKSATVFFDSVNKIRVTFTAESTENLVIKVKVNDGAEKEAAITTDGTYFYIFTDGIRANGFDDVYTFTAYINGVAGATITYSIKSYVNVMQDSTNTAMAELAKATYNYGLAAKKFAAIAG